MSGSILAVAAGVTIAIILAVFVFALFVVLINAEEKRRNNIFWDQVDFERNQLKNKYRDEIK